MNWGGLWKKSALQFLWAPLKARYSHVTTAVGTLWKQSRHIYIAVAVGPLWKQRRLLYTLQFQRGARGKCLAYLPLNIPLYIIMTMILYENMKPIEHVLLHPINVLSHLMCSCKHCNVKLSLYYWTHWSCWWVYHFKKRRYHAIFRNNLDTHRGATRIFLRGGWSYGSKSLEKEKLLAIRIGKEST